VGGAAGMATFRLVDENWIRVLLGVIALSFLAYSYYPKKSISTPSPAAGWVWSGIAGYTGFITHAGSPPLLVYLLALRLEKVTFAATSMAFFAAMNYAKII